MFLYLTLDLTETTDINPANGQFKGNNYEVELEITDITHLLNHVNDLESFNAIVLRFLQNVAIIQKIVKNATQSIVSSLQ